MDLAHSRIVSRLFYQVKADLPDVILYPTKKIKVPDHASSLAKQVGLWAGVQVKGVQLIALGEYKTKNQD